MPAFTTTQWAVLFLVLLLGWLLGLLSRSGKKWRRLYESERDARAEETAEHEAAIAAANARITELERDRPDTVRRVDPVSAPTATPATLDLTRDDLTRIRGISAGGERRLNAEGITRYRDLAGLTPADERALEERLGMDEGYIDQEQWPAQAALLDAGELDEHQRRFG